MSKVIVILYFVLVGDLLFCQIPECISNKDLELIKIGLIESMESTNGTISYNHRSLINFMIRDSASLQIVELIEPLLEKWEINCSEVRSWSLTKVYHWHDLIDWSIVVIEANPGCYYAATIDHTAGELNFFEQNLCLDYFSSISRFIASKSSDTHSDGILFTVRMINHRIDSITSKVDPGILDIEMLLSITSVLSCD